MRLLAVLLVLGCTSKVRTPADVEPTAPPDVADIVDTPDQGPGDDAGCPPTAACIEEGTRCVDGDLVECAVDPFGCLFLSVVACEDGQTCVEDADGGRCEATDACSGVSNCEVESATCDGPVALRCAPNDNGCLVRTFEDCGDAFCIDGACVEDPCEGLANPCPAEGLVCTGEVLQTCDADPFGCLTLSPVVDCAEQPGGFCSPGPPAGCKGEVKGPWTFVRIADLASTGPGGAFTFTALSRTPALDGDDVVFRAAFDDTQVAHAVLLYDRVADTLSVVVSQGEPIPSGTGGFTDFDLLTSRGVRVDGGRVVLVGNGPNAQRGIYLQGGTGLIRLVDRQTAIPGGQTFVGLSEPLLSGVRLVFNGNDFGSTGGAYTRVIDQVELVSLADKSTWMPNAVGTFVSIEATDLTESGVVALSGFGNAPAGAPFTGTLRGVYRTQVSPPTVQRVADRFDGIPGTEQRFNAFGDPHVHGEATIFVGRGDLGVKKPLGPLQHKGIYRHANDEMVALVDTQTPMPGGTETFSEEATDGLSDDHLSIDGGRVVFRGVGSTKSVVTRTGIYRVDPLDEALTIETIIDTDATLEGRPIANLAIGRQSAQDGVIGFWVQFADGGEALYLAIPSEEVP